MQADLGKRVKASVKTDVNREKIENIKTPESRIAARIVPVADSDGNLLLHVVSGSNMDPATVVSVWSVASVFDVPQSARPFPAKRIELALALHQLQQLSVFSPKPSKDTSHSTRTRLPNKLCNRAAPPHSRSRTGCRGCTDDLHRCRPR